MFCSNLEEKLLTITLTLIGYGDFDHFVTSFITQILVKLEDFLGSRL